MPRPRRTVPKARRPRFAICIDEAGTPLARNTVYRILYDDVAEREGLLCVSDEWGESHDHFEAERFLFVRCGERSKAKRAVANRILADALEREARLVERGLAERIGESYAPTLKRGPRGRSRVRPGHLVRARLLGRAGRGGTLRLEDVRRLRPSGLDALHPSCRG